jgi:hypothetical protein
MQKSAEGVGKDVLAEEGMDENQVEHVGEKLRNPRPEGQVNVESVLLFSTFNGLWKIRG